MAFHDYLPAWKCWADATKIRGNPRDCVECLINRIPKETPGYTNTKAQLMSEVLWSENKRPYYDLYPGIAQAFAKIDLGKIKCEQLSLPLPQMLIRLPVGHELMVGSRRIMSILVSKTHSHNRQLPGWLMVINDGSTNEVNGVTCPIHTVNGILFVHGTTIEERLAYGRSMSHHDELVDDNEIDMATRIVVAICLLQGDENLIEPLPLSADLDRWEKTHNLELIEKAAKRGKRGWAIGKKIELVPTFRRPHFAIRWCGKGGLEPRLRPIKGCIVLRDKATTFPTGYLDNEESRS